MKENKKILLTFDYEPFLGKKSGSVSKCVIEPTNVLISIMDKYNAKGIFFVDMLYLLNLKSRTETLEDFEIIKNQLLKLYDSKHYIFPHIHPHWLDSIFLKDIKEFDLSDLSKYSLASLPQNEIENLFKKSMDLLSEMGIAYQTYGYRAGGWCIQPFCLYEKIFEKYNILHEFSALPGYKNDSEQQKFDFSELKIREPYFFSKNVELEDKKGVFIQYPISTLFFNSYAKFKDRLVRKYLWKTGDRSWGNGIGAYTASLKTNLSNKEMISIDVLNISKLGKYKKFIREEKYMHWISHPKMFTKHGLKTFDNFLKFAHSKYNVEYDFSKYKVNKSRKNS